MRTLEVIIWILCVSFFLSLAYAVIKTAHDARENIEEITEQKEERLSLPVRCAEYYDNGTEEWINCMGVGKR